MAEGFNLDALIDALADRVADKLEARLTAAGNGAGIKPRLLTIEQAATYLGRTKEAVQHMVSSGKLPIVRGDRRIALDIQDLDRWIGSNKQKTSE